MFLICVPFLFSERPLAASGDGRDSEWATSFPGQAERALKRGWDVEVWSWAEQLTRKYNALSRAYPGRIIVKMLDPYYKAITFVKAGTYTVDNVPIAIANRVVSPLHDQAA